MLITVAAGGYVMVGVSGVDAGVSCCYDVGVGDVVGGADDYGIACCCGVCSVGSGTGGGANVGPDVAGNVAWIWC